MLEKDDKSFLEGQVSNGDLRQMKKFQLERKIHLRLRYVHSLEVILDAEKQALAKTRLAQMIRELKKEISKETAELKKLAKELKKLEEERSND
jgi:septal ring factor EnvC (AmiA/AmiB activator)